MDYDIEIMKKRISGGIHAAGGVFMGYVSVALSDVLISFAVGVVFLLFIGYVVEFLVKKKGIKWWISNGAILYILFWLVMWIFFFNYSMGP